MQHQTQRSLQTPQIGAGAGARGPRSMDILRAKHYIQHNYAKRLTLEEVSSKAFLSPAYFCTLFKREMGVGFAEYVTSVRLQAAKKFLLSPQTAQYTLKRISELVGFNSPAYFRQVFVQAFGIAPLEFKKAFSQKGPDGT